MWYYLYVRLSQICERCDIIFMTAWVKFVSDVILFVSSLESLICDMIVSYARWSLIRGAQWYDLYACWSLICKGLEWSVLRALASDVRTLLSRTKLKYQKLKTPIRPQFVNYISAVRWPGGRGGGGRGEGGIFLIMGKWSGQMLFTSRQNQMPRLWLVRTKYLAWDRSRVKPPNWLVETKFLSSDWLVKTKYLSSNWSRLKPQNWLVKTRYLSSDWSRLKPPNWLVKTKYLSSDWSRLKPHNWLFKTKYLSSDWSRLNLLIG